MARVEPSVDDDASFLVLADQLMLAGDPRGELIHLDHAIAQSSTDELVEARERLLTRHPALVPGHGLRDATWRLGFVRELAFDLPRLTREVAPGTELGELPALLAHPSLLYVQRLLLDGDGFTQLQLERVGRILPAGLRSLVIGAPWTGRALVYQYRLDHVIPAGVTELEVSFRFTVARSLPSVRAFATSAPANQTLASVVVAMPNLERVSLLGTTEHVSLARLCTLPLREFMAVYVPITAREI
ncbi:MAG TPA: hypothetical protein VGC41_26910, partial [Kofleriaceae bacterium]